MENTEKFNKFSNQEILSDAIANHESIVTLNGSLDTKKLKPGDKITIEFYAAEDSFTECSPISLVATDTLNEYLLSKLGTDKPQKIILIGSYIHPHVRAHKPAKIEAGLFIGYKIFNEKLADKQRLGESLIQTFWGKMRIDELRNYFKSNLPGGKIEEAVNLYLGYQYEFTPKVANFSVSS